MVVFILLELLAVVISVVLIRIYFRVYDEELYLSNDKKLRINHPVKVHKIFLVIIFGLFVFFWVFWQFRDFAFKVTLEYKLLYLWAGCMYFYYYVSSEYYGTYILPDHIDDDFHFDMFVSVLIPVYNENEEALKKCIDSIFAQSRVPDEIHVVNDGSLILYEELRLYFHDQCVRHGIVGSWQYQKNAGKRTAQVTGFQNAKKVANSVIVTIDSDGILDSIAIEEACKPFIEEDVMSVAGMVLCNNVYEHWLVKIAELIFISQQLTERAFMSIFGSVPVNSGALAVYRYAVLEKAVKYGYLKEEFSNDRVEFSDDSFLTLIAMSLGRTVFQDTAKVYSDMPVKLKQHAKQQSRWNKGAFIRGFWRIRYSKANSVIFIKQFTSWVFFPVILSLLVYIGLFKTQGYIEVLQLISLPIFFGYLSFFRYMEINRNDMSKLQQFFLVLFYTPIATFWNIFVIKPIKIHAMLTVNRRGWGTRTTINK